VVEWELFVTSTLAFALCLFFKETKEQKEEKILHKFFIVALKVARRCSIGK
jgi:hypothetical protein